MFCPKCGKQNQSENTYCIFCGAELIDNQNFGVTHGAGKYTAVLRSAERGVKKALGALRTFLKQHRGVAVPVGAVVVVILAVLIIGSSVFTPKREAERYFRAVVGANAKLAYSCIDIPSSPFTTHEAFSVFWEDEHQKQDVYNYSITEQEGYRYDYSSAPSEDTISHTFLVRYYLRGSSDEDTMMVTVVKSSQKRFLLFPNYKVLPTFLVNDFKIAVPAGTTATLGGTMLTNPVTDDGADVYTVASLFFREYELQVTSDLCVPSVQSVWPQSDSLYACDDIQYTVATAVSMYQLAQGHLKTLIGSALAYSVFPGSIACDKNGTAYEDYQRLMTDLRDPKDGTGFQAINITATSDISYEQAASVDGVGYCCYILFDFSYSAVRGDWGGEKLADSGDAQAEAEMYYSYIDGQWVLTDFEIS